MQNVPLSFREWCYPTKHKRSCHCSWGNCGYIAISHKNVITIYKFDGIQYTIYLSWSPYDSAEVTAIGWLDGSCAPCESRPVIAASFSNGSTLCFDLDSQTVISKIKHNNQIVKVIKWSPYNPNEFYTGTEDGQFSIYELTSENENTVIKAKEKFSFGFSIDFISIDKLNGSTIVATSRNGKIAYIKDLYQVKNARYTKSNENYSSKKSQYYVKRNLNITDNKKNLVNSIEFLPGQYLYLLISTNELSYVYLLNDGVSLPFIGAKGIKYIYPHYSKNHFYIVFKGLIELWSYHYDELNPVGDLKKLFTIDIKRSNNSDIECYDFLNDKMVIFTKSAWLTKLEEKKEKLFITQRSRMMPPKPIDWDFRGSQIAFLTSDGQVVLTEKVDNINVLKDVPKRDSLHFYIPPPPEEIKQEQESTTATTTTANGQISSERIPSFSNQSGFRTAFDPTVLKVPNANDALRKRAQSFQADQNKIKLTDSEFSIATIDPKEAKKKARKDSSAKEVPKKSGGFFGFFKNKNKDKAKSKKKDNEPEPDGDTLYDLDEENEANRQNEKSDHENDEIDSEDDLMDAFDEELSSHKGKDKTVSHSVSNSSLNSASNTGTNAGSATAEKNVDEIEFFCSHSPTQAIKLNTLIQPKTDAKVGCSLSFTNSFTADPNRFHFDNQLYFSHIYNTISSMTIKTTTINEDENAIENENDENNENENINNENETEKTEKEFNTTITTVGAIDVSTSVNDYLMNPNWKLNVQHLKWISKNKIIAWGNSDQTNHIVLINIKTRKVINLMNDQLKNTKRPITDIKFSKDMKIAFISFGDRFIAFFRLSKPYQWIGAIKFKKESIGDFSPDYLKTDFFDNVNAIDDDEDDEDNESNANESGDEDQTKAQPIAIDFGLGTGKSETDLKKVYLAAFFSEGLTLTVVKINKSPKTPVKIVFERTFKLSKSTPSSFLWKGKIEKETQGLYQTNKTSSEGDSNKFYMFLGSKEGRLFRIDFTDTFNIVRADDKNVNQNDILIKQLAAVGGGAITSISPLILPDRTGKNKEASREKIITSFENLNELNDKGKSSDDDEEKEKAETSKSPASSQALENLENFFILTNSGQAFMIKNGKQFEMKSHIKHAKFATDLTMLVRFAHSGSLTRVEYTTSPRSIFIKATSKLLNAYDRKVNLDLVIGDGSYSLPPVTFRPQTNFINEVKKQKSIEDMISVCRLYGENYIAHALELIVKNDNKSEYLTDFWFLRFLNKSRFYSDQFFKSALFASKLDLAHRILMDTEPDSPQFILNMTRASFFDMPLLLEKARQQLVEANEEFDRMKKAKELEKKEKQKMKKKNKKKGKKKFILVNREKEVTKIDDDGNETTEIETVEEEEEVIEEEDNGEEEEKKKTIDEVLEIDSVVVEEVKNDRETVSIFGNKMEAALKSMISTNRYNDAVQTLLMIGQVSRAVELLIKNSNLREAALLSSMWPLAPFVLLNPNYDNEEEEEDKHENNTDTKKLMLEVSEKFCKEGGFLTAISLLAGAGMNKEAIDLVTKNVEAFPKIIKGIHINNLETFDEGSGEDSDDVNDWV